MSDPPLPPISSALTLLLLKYLFFLGTIIRFHLKSSSSPTPSNLSLSLSGFNSLESDINEAGVEER